MNTERCDLCDHAYGMHSDPVEGCMVITDGNQFPPVICGCTDTTAYLLSNPETAARLRASLSQFGEPSPIRDNGPFDNPDQALKQYAAQTHGMPFSNGVLSFQVIQEALLLTGADPSMFEIQYLREHNDRTYDSIQAMIVASLIMRAHLAGSKKKKDS